MKDKEMVLAHGCLTMQSLEHGNWGAAITAIISRDEGKTWLADNGEYETRVYYCPFCGVTLEGNVGKEVSVYDL